MRFGRLLWGARQHLNYSAFSLQQIARRKGCRPGFITPGSGETNTEVADIGAGSLRIWTFPRRTGYGAGYTPREKKDEKHESHAELQTPRDCYSAADLSIAAKPDDGIWVSDFVKEGGCGTTLGDNWCDGDFSPTIYPVRQLATGRNTAFNLVSSTHHHGNAVRVSDEQRAGQIL